jgi:hypothetical protein
MSCAEAPSPSRLTLNIPEAVCSTSGALGPAPVPPKAGRPKEMGWRAPTRVEGSTPEPLQLRRLPNVYWPCGLEFFHEVGAKLLVEIGPEGWTPTQQPPEFSPSLRLLP